jgi:hypothetical protein
MKKNRSEKEWRDLFTEQKRSGKTVRDFCRSKGVNENVFFRKKKQLGGTVTLVRLPVGLSDSAPIEITVGGVRIGVGSGFEERELVRVLRCVREAMDA